MQRVSNSNSDVEVLETLLLMFCYLSVTTLLLGGTEIGMRLCDRECT